MADTKKCLPLAQVSRRAIRLRMLDMMMDMDLTRELPSGQVRTKYQVTKSLVDVIEEYASAELQKVDDIVTKIMKTTVQMGEGVNENIGNKNHRIYRLLRIWVERSRNTEIERARKEATAEIA